MNCTVSLMTELLLTNFNDVSYPVICNFSQRVSTTIIIKTFLLALLITFRYSVEEFYVDLYFAFYGLFAIVSDFYYI